MRKNNPGKSRFWRLSLSLAVIFLILFYLSKDNFFHWDEWNFFMLFNKPFSNIWFLPYGEHFIPLNILNHYILFKIFGLTYLPFQIVVLLFHLGSLILLYKIVLKLTKVESLAILSVFLFGLANIYNENILWSQGVSNVGSATLVFLAYWLLENYFASRKLRILLFSSVCLVLSPLFHDLSFLTPFAFAAVVIFRTVWKRENHSIAVLIFTLAGIANSLILWNFSSDKVTGLLLYWGKQPFYLKIPVFIFWGITRGLIARLIYPGFHLIPGQQQTKEIFVVLSLAGIVIIVAAIFLSWLKKSSTRLERLYYLSCYFVLIASGYFAVSLGRGNQGISIAGIARYTYQPFFFLLLLLSIFLKDNKRFLKIGLVAGFLIFAVNLTALIRFENDFWSKMTMRDRQFSQEISYLNAKNDVVYDFSVPGINPNIKLSKLWFLFPGKSPKFIAPLESIVYWSDLSSDTKSQRIYQKLATDYQKKFD